MGCWDADEDLIEDKTMSSKQEKLRLGSIADEASACRKAFEHVEIGTWVVHCHHSMLFETLTEPAENRIAFILSSKPEHEQALRLRLFRPLPQTAGKKLASLFADYKAKLASLVADYQAKCAPLYADHRAKRASIHAKNCIAGCPWDGITIFTKT